MHQQLTRDVPYVVSVQTQTARSVLQALSHRNRTSSRGSASTTAIKGANPFPRSAWEMPSATLRVVFQQPLTSRSTRRHRGATRSHALRGNAVFDAPRRLPATVHQSVDTEIQGGNSFPRSAWECRLRRSASSSSSRSPVGRHGDTGGQLVPTLCVGMPSSTLRVVFQQPFTSRSTRRQENRFSHSSWHWNTASASDR